MLLPLLHPLLETAAFLEGAGPGRGYVFLERPDGTELPFPVAVHAFQTQRRVNATGVFAVAIPANIRIDDDGTLASQIVSGWRVTLRQEGNNPYGAYNTALMTRGRVNGRSFQLAGGSALIVLKGNFRSFDIAREELHGDQTFTAASGRAIAQNVAGQTIIFKGGDDAALTLGFTGGTRMAATLKTLQILRATLRENWEDNLEAVDVDGAPNSSVTLTVTEQVDPSVEGLAFGANGSSLPNQAEGGIALLADGFTFTYDGSNLMNTVIPYGLDGDNTDLSIQYAWPINPPFPIVQIGDKWGITDTTSVETYGPWEQRVYWNDIRNPFDAKASGLFTLVSLPQDGDAFSYDFEVWTYRTTPSVQYEIKIGATTQEAFANTRAALFGTDGLNAPSATIEAIAQIDTLVMRFTSSAKGEAGNVATAGTFADPGNGFNKPTALGGEYSRDTATAVYWRAVNELITYRAEVLVVQCLVANGADVWALPGDRIGFRFRGLAATIESDGEEFAWLDEDRPMLITAREDRSDPSGVRQVRLTVCASAMPYLTPAIPGWDSPVSLPVPDRVGDILTFEGEAHSNAPADLLDAYKRLISRSGTGTSQCCPNPDVEHSAGARTVPPIETGD